MLFYFSLGIFAGIFFYYGYKIERTYEATSHLLEGMELQAHLNELFNKDLTNLENDVKMLKEKNV
jgi:hypothetical protein